LTPNDDGRVLLVRRADDRLWAMPGGWVDAAETSEQGAVREVLEETGLHVAVVRLLHTARRSRSIHRTYGCSILGGELRRSEESIDVALHHADTVREWHADHRERVAVALGARSSPVA
jgi:8-oxo-dGTP pyrophosphatase MutT (NUDIX family)